MPGKSTASYTNINAMSNVALLTNNYDKIEPGMTMEAGRRGFGDFSAYAPWDDRL